jgi:hypothetical protein
MKAQKGSGGVALLILNLGASCTWVVNATLLPLYLRERTPVPIVQGLVGPQGRPGR